MRKEGQIQHGDESEFREERGVKHEEFNWLTSDSYLGPIA